MTPEEAQMKIEKDKEIYDKIFETVEMKVKIMKMVMREPFYLGMEDSAREIRLKEILRSKALDYI